MDINAYLKEVTTAPEDNGASSQAWVRGRKRRSSRTSGGGPEDANDAKSARAEAAAGLDMDQVRAEIAKERLATSQDLLRRSAAANELTEQEAATSAHLVIEYVMLRERGGRHNAVRADSMGPASEEAAAPSPSRLAAERAHLTPTAAYDITHVAHRARRAGAAVAAVYSEPRRERAHDGVVAYRQSLRVCDVEADLVGGAAAGLAPHIRSYALCVVLAGLRGEAWVREEGDATPGKPTSGSGVAAATTPVILFGGEAGGGGDDDADAFSLDAFLNDSSDSAAEDGGGEGE